MRLGSNLEVRYWMQVLSVTRAQLWDAVQAVGASSAAVQAHIERLHAERRQK